MFKSLIILYKIVYVNRFAKKTVERSVLGNILLCIRLMDIPVQKKVPYSQNTVIQCASKKQASFQLTCSQNCTMLVQMINRCGGDIIIMMLRYNQLGHNTISIFLDGYIHNKNMKRGKTPKNGKPLNNKSCRATQRLYLVVVVSTEGVAATVYVINVKPVVKAVTANAAAFQISKLWKQY